MKSKSWFFWLCAGGACLGALALGAIGENELNKERRAEECRVLAAIGVKAGDHITIYGDMPTWKIACLMGDGDN